MSEFLQFSLGLFLLGLSLYLYIGVFVFFVCGIRAALNMMGNGQRTESMPSSKTINQMRAENGLPPISAGGSP